MRNANWFERLWAAMFALIVAVTPALVMAQGGGSGGGSGGGGTGGGGAGAGGTGAGGTPGGAGGTGAGGAGDGGSGLGWFLVLLAIALVVYFVMRRRRGTPAGQQR